MQKTKPETVFFARTSREILKKVNLQKIILNLKSNEEWLLHSLENNKKVLKNKARNKY